MRKKKSPIAVFVALVFAMALASPALAADPRQPANPDMKAWMDSQKKPNQPAKPIQPQPVDRIGSKQPPKPPAATPQAVRPVAPSAKPPEPAQPARPSVKSPGPPPQDAKKNATFVNKVNTAPGSTPANNKMPVTSYDRTAKDLGR